MASREIEWLKREVDAWERDGIVDTATAERLRTRYAQVAANTAPATAIGIPRWLATYSHIPSPAK